MPENRAHMSAMIACLALSTLLLCLAPSCESPEPRRVLVESAAPVEVERRRPPRFEQVGRDTYIYRMQSLRAAETAETLQVLRDSAARSGREIIIVPQEQTNILMFRVVPRQPGDDASADSRRFRLSR